MNTRKRFQSQISVPVTQRTYEKLNELAEIREVTVAHITREILEEALFGARQNKAHTQETN